ncbi:hypothetical protein F5X96DRAFT_670133 [Biscogniauxia mediterranea]|nr:hypothetical protein F5X96DRAFT_670133 [Biscogniauxia mediterranea]
MPGMSIATSDTSRATSAPSDENSCGCLASLDPLPRLVAQFRRCPRRSVPCTQCQTLSNKGVLELIEAVDSAPVTTCAELQHLALAVFRTYGARTEDNTPGPPWGAVLCELERTLWARRGEAPLANLIRRLQQGREWGWTWTADAARGIAYAALDDYEWMIAQGYVLDPRDPQNRERLAPTRKRIGELHRDAAHTETGEALRDLLLFLRERCSERNNPGSWSPGRLDTLFRMICPGEEEG